MFEYKRVRLEPYTVAFQEHLPDHILRTVRGNSIFKEYRKEVGDHLFLQCVTHVMSETKLIKPEKRILVPTTWWQAFKRDVVGRSPLAKWLLKYFPVIAKPFYVMDKSYERTFLYPSIPCDPNDPGKPMDVIIKDKEI